jgi:hypothetical protein
MLLAYTEVASCRSPPPDHRCRYRCRTQLTTKRLDGRSTIAVAVRRWKDDVRRDLGGDLSRAQEAIVELAAQSWVIVSSVDDWIGRLPSLVTKKRPVLDGVMRAKPVADLATSLTSRATTPIDGSKTRRRA